MSGIKKAKVSVAKSIHWNLSGLLNIYVNIDKHNRVGGVGGVEGHSQTLTNASNCAKLIKMHFIYEIYQGSCFRGKTDTLNALTSFIYLCLYFYNLNNNLFKI